MKRILVIGIAGREQFVGDVRYLQSYDVDAAGGRGVVKLTTDRKRAMLFSSHETAWAAWSMQSSVQPLRDDGKPNRPLTAYNVIIEEAV